MRILVAVCLLASVGVARAEAPAAIARVKEAIIVSPAPETSKTSCATVGI